MSVERNLLQAEMKKSLGANPWFWASTCAGCALALLAAFLDSFIFQNTLEYALSHWDDLDSLYSVASCFAFWMPVEAHKLIPGVFVMVWPLLVVIPYAWSWSSELRSGVMAQLCSRASRRGCVCAKLVATFVSGALAMVLPLLVNLIACACFAPATEVWVSDMIYLGVTRSAPLSSLYYTAPLVFCLAWTVIASIVAGLWASAVCALAAALRSFLRAAILSYLFLHVLAFLGSQLRGLLFTTLTREAMTLLSFDVFSVVSVRSSPGAGWALIITIVSLVVLTSALSAFRERRDLL